MNDPARKTNPLTRLLLETVEYRRPACPVCGGFDLRAFKSEQGGDGSLTRWTQCQNTECRYRFKIVFEP